MEGAELHGDARPDADERGERAFVEGGGAFGGEDAARGVQGAGVLGGGLQADFDDVWGGLVRSEVGGWRRGYLPKGCPVLR